MFRNNTLCRNQTWHHNSPCDGGYTTIHTLSVQKSNQKNQNQIFFCDENRVMMTQTPVAQYLHCIVDCAICITYECA